MSGSSTVKLFSLISFSTLSSLEQSYYVQPHLRKGELCPLLVDGVSPEATLNSSAQTIGLFSPMGLLIPSLTYTSVDSWIFISARRFSSNTALFGCSNGCSSGHWKFFPWDPIALWHSPIITGLVFLVVLLFLFSALSCFLALQRLQAHLGQPVPQSWSPRVSHFSKPWFLLLANNVRNQDRDASYGRHARDKSLPSQRQSREMCVCANPCVSTRALRHLHATVSISTCKRVRSMSPTLTHDPMTYSSLLPLLIHNPLRLWKT